MPDFGLKSLAGNMKNLFRSNKRQKAEEYVAKAKKEIDEDVKVKEKRTAYGGGKRSKIPKGNKGFSTTAHRTLESFHFGTFRPMSLKHRD
jgi:hypothetical protein